MLANKVPLKRTNINNSPFILQYNRLSSNGVLVLIIKHICLTELGLPIIPVSIMLWVNLISCTCRKRQKAD